MGSWKQYYLSSTDPSQDDRKTLDIPHTAHDTWGEYFENAIQQRMCTSYIYDVQKCVDYLRLDALCQLQGNDIV